MLTLAALLTTKPSRPGQVVSVPTRHCRYHPDGIEVDRPDLLVAATKVSHVSGYRRPCPAEYGIHSTGRFT